MKRIYNLSEALRAAVICDGRPLRQIAALARLPASSVSRFVSRKRGLSTAGADRVAAVVAWELRPVKRSA